MCDCKATGWQIIEMLRRDGHPWHELTVPLGLLDWHDYERSRFIDIQRFTRTSQMFGGKGALSIESLVSATDMASSAFSKWKLTSSTRTLLGFKSIPGSKERVGVAHPSSVQKERRNAVEETEAKI